MRKKLFAILMTIMMMATFMPSMAFAIEKAEEPLMTSEIKDKGGFNFESINYNSTEHNVDSSGKVIDKFLEDSSFNIHLSDQGFTAGEYTLKASVKGDVAVYWSNNQKEVFDMSKKSPTFSYSGNKWFENQYSCNSLYAVVKNDKLITKAFTISFSLVKGTKKVAELVLPFNTECAEAKLGDFYYAYLNAAIDAVKPGQTVTMVRDVTYFENKNMPSRGFILDGDSHSITVSAQNPILDLGEGNTYKNLSYNSNVQMGSNTTVIDSFNDAGNTKVCEGCTGIILKNSSGSTLDLAVGSSAKLIGVSNFGAGIQLEKNTALDASEWNGNKEINKEITVLDPLSTNVIVPTNDDRWCFNGTNAYSLCGVYRYDGKTYLTWNEVSEAIKADATPTVKIVGSSEKSDIIAPVEGQTITLTGTIDSCFKGQFDLGKGGKLNIKSGRYSSEMGVTKLIDSGYPGRTDIVDENAAILQVGKDSQFLIVGNELCLNHIKERGAVVYDNIEDVNAVRLQGKEPYGDNFIELGTLSAKSICDAVAVNRTIGEKNKYYYVCVAGKAEEELLEVGKEFSTDITKYILFHNWSPVTPGRVLGVQISSTKYVVLGGKEYYDYYDRWELAEKHVDKTKVTIKSRALSTTSAQLYADEKEFDVEVAGKTGMVTGLKAGAIKTYTAKPYVTVALGKVKVYGKSQKVVVKSRAYTPTVKAGKKSIKVSFNKMSGAKKYQISVSRSKTKTNVKTSSTKRSLKLKNLKSNKTYYVKVRTVNSKGVKGAWSVVKAVKVK